MCDKKSALCLDFENELWLYSEGILPSERMEFWMEHLSGCEECKMELEEEISTARLIKEKTLEEIDDLSFDRMISKATEKKRITAKNIFDLFEYFKDNSGIYSKAAFASALLIIALIISLSSRQPVAVKNPAPEILDWNGTEVTQKIDELKSEINFMSEDGWDRQIIQLDKSLSRMEKEIKSY